MSRLSNRIISTERAVKIPLLDAIISRNKLTDYLLRSREKDDKSGFLATVGFTQDNPDALEAAIRSATASAEAVLDRQNLFGTFYLVRQRLIGPNGRELRVIIVWQKRIDESYSFVTLYPDKE